MRPLDVLRCFDDQLVGAGLTFQAVVIGGTALSLLNVISRATRDVDVLDPTITREVLAVASSVAAELRERGISVEDDWLNNGPLALQDALPAGWRDRLSPLFAGKAIELSTLGRGDLLKTKLFAFCDRGFDHADCLAMAPTRRELEEALPWLQKQDAHPGWPAHAAATLATLAQELGHGL